MIGLCLNNNMSIIFLILIKKDKSHIFRFEGKITKIEYCFQCVEAIINNLRRDSQINEAIVLELKDEPDNGSLFTLILQKR